MVQSTISSNWRLVVTVILLLSATLGLQMLSHGSPTISQESLDMFPQQIGDWNGVDEPIDERTEEVLAATELLNRIYVDSARSNALGMFVAFFASQRKGGAIHSPKNCLPGAGWSAVEAGTTMIEVPGYAQPLTVNRYVIQKDLDKQIVLYWYQSHGRVIASEYSAKAYLIWDALHQNRTDGALVRVVSPVVDKDEAAALERAKSFVQQAFPHLEQLLPS